MTPQTRVLGLDYGTRRIGAAVSDPRRKIATPLEVYERRDSLQDARHYRKLIEEHDVDLIVIGLPVHSSGKESPLSTQARAWGKWLQSETGLPIAFFDERNTSREADEILMDVGFKVKDRKARRDMLAAQILLRNFLDAGCPLQTEPPEAIEDSQT
jgi:putative Holliday junction resolvase